jgi:hypothetical protein
MASMPLPPPLPGIARGSRSYCGRLYSNGGSSDDDATFTRAWRLDDHKLTLPLTVAPVPRPSASQSPLLERASQVKRGDEPPSSPKT